MHVSQIRSGRKRWKKAQDACYEVDDLVYVKLKQIKDDGKLSFSIKECDQESGVDLNPEKIEQ